LANSWATIGISENKPNKHGVVRLMALSDHIKRRKVGSIPAKADLQRQAEFLSDELQPRLQEAQIGARQIFLSMPRILS